MSKVKQHSYYICDICDDTIKVKGGIYPKSIGFRLIKKIGMVMGLQDGGIHTEYEIEDMHFCIDCWYKITKTVEKLKESK